MIAKGYKYDATEKKFYQEEEVSAQIQTEIETN